MKLAAIDIGSNAARLQIVNVFEEGDQVSFKRIQFLRYPLRLGKDVFKHGSISEQTFDRYKMLMQTYRNLLDLYQVDHYWAVATSAMREAKNAKAVKAQLLADTGIDIEVITGSKEAKVLQKAILPFLDKEDYLHIDVGGGSTELNFFAGRKLRKSRSFKLGSVRKLSRKERTERFAEIKDWIQSSPLSKKKNICSIGTGGNINRLYKIANKGSNIYLPYAELKALQAYVNAFSIPERESFLKMNPDRADVIIPAADIYIRSMSYVQSDRIMVPKVGLKDGLIYELYAGVSERDISEVEFL